MACLKSLALAVSVAIGITAASAQTNGNATSKLRLVTGVVKSVSASSLILGLGDNTFMVIAVASSTRFVRKGARPRDLVNRWPRRITDFVKVGDQVRVTYRQSGSDMNAVEVRVAPR